MNWNPNLIPYKNAITNELYTAASIAMYLYFPGDNNSAPFLSSNTREETDSPAKIHDPVHLENAIKAYKWLKDSHTQNPWSGLYQDGFHIHGWRKLRNGTIDPGTGNCDELNTMVYTYNQGVILSASRGLWMATGARSYLDDGHALIESVVKATGWPNHGTTWHGLGRGGIMEEFCDHNGQCSQDGQTFKGIFFLHLTEFCRPLWAYEEELMSMRVNGYDRAVYRYHLSRCAAYGKWIAHNAQAAKATKDKKGRFGMWWTVVEPDDDDMYNIRRSTVLPPDAVDHLNPSSGSPANDPIRGSDLNDRGRGRTVETQSGGLAVLRAHWNWMTYFG